MLMTSLYTLVDRGGGEGVRKKFEAFLVVLIQVLEVPNIREAKVGSQGPTKTKGAVRSRYLRSCQ